MASAMPSSSSRVGSRPSTGMPKSVVTAGVNEGSAEARAAPSARTAPPNAATPSTPPSAPWKNHCARMVPAGTGGGLPPVRRTHAGTMASADGMVTAATARTGATRQRRSRKVNTPHEQPASANSRSPSQVSRPPPASPS